MKDRCRVRYHHHIRDWRRTAGTTNTWKGGKWEYEFALDRLAYLVSEENVPKYASYPSLFTLLVVAVVGIVDIPLS